MGRDVAPTPHVTFERSKVTKTLSEGFRSPQTLANGSCRELFKYKLLSTDFYVGARSEVSGATIKSTVGENYHTKCSLKHNVDLNFCSLPLGAIYSFSDLVRMKKYFHLGLWQKNL